MQRQWQSWQEDEQLQALQYMAEATFSEIYSYSHESLMNKIVPIVGIVPMVGIDRRIETLSKKYLFFSDAKGTRLPKNSNRK